MWWVVGAIVALIVLLAIFNRRTLFKFGESANAQVSAAGRWAWNKDPNAIYQHRIDEAADEINEATRSVEEHRGLVNSLSRQVEDGKREVAVLESRIKALLKDDPEDKSGKAAEYAQKHVNAKNNLAKNQAQYDKALTLYNNNIKKISLARQKISDAEARGKQLGVELKMAKTDAAISELAQKTNINIKSVGGLSEVEAEIQRQIDTARAKSDVAADLGTDGMAEIQEEERILKADANAALEEFKRNMK